MESALGKMAKSVRVGVEKPGPRGAARAGSVAHRDARGVPAAACRWRAGPGHLLSLRKLHVYEREGENVQFYTSLPRPVSNMEKKKTLSVSKE